MTGILHLEKRAWYRESARMVGEHNHLLSLTALKDCMAVILTGIVVEGQRLCATPEHKNTVEKVFDVAMGSRGASETVAV